MQEIDVKNGTVTVQDYYATLSKKEKSQFLRFLIVQYGFAYGTLQNKMTGYGKFNPRDLLIVQTVINQGLWKSK